MITRNDEKCNSARCKLPGVVSLWDAEKLARKSYCLTHYSRACKMAKKRTEDKEMRTWLASL